MPVASQEMMELLNDDITESDVQMAIQKLGYFDGYFSEFYKLLRDKISPTLVRYINTILNTRIYVRNLKMSS